MSDPVTVNLLKGRLVKSHSGWVLLSIPNAILRGMFDALHAPGAELPKNKRGQLNAHISVMRPEELEKIGNPDITELGRFFAFQLGQLQEVNPIGWEEMDRVWFVRASSPELVKLRRSYGLPDMPTRRGKQLHFHFTIAVRRKGVLRANDLAKQAWGEVLWKKAVDDAVLTAAAMQDQAADRALNSLQRRDYSKTIENLGVLTQLWKGQIAGIPNYPSALSSMLVTGMLGGGLGYLGGRAIGAGIDGLARLGLSKGVDKGRIARVGRNVGIGVGMLPGLLTMYGNKKMGLPLLRGDFFNHRIDKQSNAGQVFNADEFRRLVYEDPFVSMRLNPREKAMATGLVVGAQHLPGRSPSPLVTPIDIARMAVGMGSGYLSGALVGRTLGHIMGLPQEAQDTIIRSGTFAGAVKSILPVIYGTD